MLAVPETLPLFLRKYQHRQIKQYRRREPVYKGAGDIICCLDESGSTAGDLAAWGKAVALTLLEIAQSEGRKFALVHFSGPGRFQTDVFLPGQSSLEEKLHAAETFLGGGTDFQTPLAEAERLMREGGFENADIAFITDGECSLPGTCVEMLQKAQSELRFTVTGILLDEGNAGMDFSLKPFCQNIYRTSELTGDQIVGGNCVGSRMILVARRKETGYNIMKYKDEGGRLCRLFTMEAEWLWNNPRSAFKNSIRIFLLGLLLHLL